MRLLIYSSIPYSAYQKEFSMKKLTLLFTAILTVLLFALPVYAADIMLSSSCTLVDAIIAANNDRAEGNCPAGRGTDTITLTRDITLDSGLPKITSDITIEGEGYTISGDNRWQIFYNDGGALTINDLTMTKGRVEVDLIRNTDGTLKVTMAQLLGGALVNWKGTLNIVNSTFSYNEATDSGGAIRNEEGTLNIINSSFIGNLAGSGGAIHNDEGTLSIINSTFSHNLADDGGGAIDNWGELSIVNSTLSDNSADSFGGAIYNAGELSISTSAFNDNLAGLAGGTIGNTGELSVSDSAFSDNWAKFAGGAISNVGELSIVNSTFSHNSADSSGAIGNTGELSIINSTFSSNSAEKGGAIYNGEDGKLRITNSIIAGRGENACYSSGELKRNINNFIQDDTCSPAFSGDPKLGELVEPEDGSPAYFPLLVGSPAIDAADDDYCPETDQIGTDRPQGAGCDIGAFEYVAES